MITVNRKRITNNLLEKDLTALVKSFQDGYEAAGNGRYLFDNPHPYWTESIDYIAWKKGFCAWHIEHKKETQTT